MINGLHAMVYAKDAERVRAFFRDILKFPAIDAGGGWLVFGLPPTELGVHPTRGKGFQEIYLMCVDVKATVKKLKSKGVKFSGRIRNEGWGLATTIKLPGGGELGLYEPKHPTILSKRGRR